MISESRTDHEIRCLMLCCVNLMASTQAHGPFARNLASFTFTVHIPKPIPRPLRGVQLYSSLEVIRGIHEPPLAQGAWSSPCDHRRSRCCSSSGLAGAARPFTTPHARVHCDGSAPGQDMLFVVGVEASRSGSISTGEVRFSEDLLKRPWNIMPALTSMEQWKWTIPRLCFQGGQSSFCMSD